MINFVICDKDLILLNKYIDIIDKFMMQCDIEYKFHIYENYEDDWKDYAKKEDGFKIYLLSLDSINDAGLTSAKLIREDYDDWVSMIIILSSTNKRKNEILNKQLMILDFINNSINLELQLKSALIKCMKNYDNRHKTLKYKYKNDSYSIDLRQIITIEKEPDNKRCIIKTSTNTYIIPGTLKSIMNKLDKRFMRCCSNTVINVEQIARFISKENKIVFKNGKSINNVSRTYKKEIVKIMRGID